MLDKIIHNITETIIKRSSCRTFTGEYLSSEQKSDLEDFILETNTAFSNNISIGEKIFLLEKGPQERAMKLLYGAIKGNNSYLLGITKDDKRERVNYAYKMQKIVLKATEMGLGTCWVGYFDHDYFSDIVPEKGYVVPGIVLIGNAAPKRSITEKLVRFSANAAQRVAPDKLFFNYSTMSPINGEIPEGYRKALEMVRLAPSSSNSQPWRVYYEKTSSVFHFFKKPKNLIYERMGMHELDMGIAMSHFELSAESYGLQGEWLYYGDEFREDGKAPFVEGLEYIISWKEINN